MNIFFHNSIDNSTCVLFLEKQMVHDFDLFNAIFFLPSPLFSFLFLFSFYLHFFLFLLVFPIYFSPFILRYSISTLSSSLLHLQSPAASLPNSCTTSVTNLSGDGNSNSGNPYSFFFLFYFLFFCLNLNLSQFLVQNLKFCSKFEPNLQQFLFESVPYLDMSIYRG